MITKPKGINPKFQGNFLKHGTWWDRGHPELKPQGSDLLLSYGQVKERWGQGHPEASTMGVPTGPCFSSKPPLPRRNVCLKCLFCKYYEETALDTYTEKLILVHLPEIQPGPNSSFMWFYPSSGSNLRMKMWGSTTGDPKTCFCCVQIVLSQGQFYLFLKINFWPFNCPE